MCVGLSGTNMVEPIKMPCGICTWVGPRNHLLGGAIFLGGRGAVKNVQSDSSRCVQCWYLHVNTGIIFVLSAFANTDRSFIDNVMLVWLEMLDGNNLLTSACPSVFLIKQYLSTLYAIEKPSVL